ncbi:MAG: alcohol dehydrogenase catalytic domain-containing protein [Chloroflexi bacterium]|nr:alcohol dehydrogenase catalytic domain-containing protein [Chloroflexota bacterium]
MSDTMRAALWTGPESVACRTVSRPVAGPGQALVRVAYGGICGTDLMIYLGKHARAVAPLVMCHEFVGTIAWADGEAFPVGAPVAINPLLSCGHCYACTHGRAHVCETLKLVGIDTDGGFAEYAVVPLHTVRPLPPELPLIEAALAEPLAVAVHAVRVSDLKVGDVTAVLGAGPIGIMTAQVARLAGARRVLVSERSPKRLEIARTLGFDAIDSSQTSPVEAIRAATAGGAASEGAGVPVVFETAGVQATIADALAVARIGGQILQVGMPKTPPTLDVTRLIFREVRLTPIRVYREEDFDQAIAIAATGRLDLRTPVTHVLPLEQLGEALELAHAATDSCKILIEPR